MKKQIQPKGMTAFSIIWVGQMISMLGTAMTSFAITIWAWQITGEATTLALVALASFGPQVLLSPVAGALVDRWNRKTVMMVSDLAAGLSTIVLLLLFSTDSLQIWHLYLAGAFAGAFGAFQFPAYSAAITMMLPKEHYSRANGMLGLTEPASQIAAPLLAGFLLVFMGLGGIFLIDIATFLFALVTLLVVYIPQPQETEAGQAGRGNLWQESIYGFKYIKARPSLLGLQLVFSAGNFVSSATFVLMPALILTRTANDEIAFATVQSAVGIGGVIGGVLLSVWAGPTRRIHGVLISWIFAGLLGNSLMGLGQSIWIWSLSAFCLGFFIPFINGSNQAIWQSKVAPDVQGRVFASRRLIAQITGPIGMLLAAPLVDYVFEPAMMPGGRLSFVFGDVVGVGPGAGIGLMFVIIGLLTAIIGACGYIFSAIRNVEDILPDHDVIKKQPPAEQKQPPVEAIGSTAL